METILLAVTAVSLLVAFIMSAAAWRASREERARAAARVAALAAAASAPDAGAAATPTLAVAPAKAAAAPVEVPPPLPEPEPVAVTIEPRTPWTPSRVSTFAPVRPVTASAARVADLTLNTSNDELPLRPAASYGDRPAVAPMADTFLGGETRPPSETRQRGLAVAAAILFVLLGGGAYWTLAGGRAATEGASAAAGASTAPLELMSLRHERIGSRLSLSGLVRNPGAGATVEGLTAVVFLFDAQGGFISSARAGVDFKRLAPGDESPFVITVNAPSNVARYRVSFRTEAGILAHVDRRNQQPVTTAIAGSKR
jgi:hypothetical protein